MSLLLDDHTLKDLEIFASPTAEGSLFDFCNLTRMDGGAKALHRRMSAPWSHAEDIRATQQSIEFIISNRQAFSRLPSAYVTSRVERYVQSVLPVITHQDPVGFTLGAVAMWADDNSRYINILTAVGFVRDLVHALEEFSAQVDSASPAGELAPLLAEIRTLLERPALADLPERGQGKSFWRVLRLDQLFRLHEKEALTRLVLLVYEIDALVSMADVTAGKGFVLPHIEEGPPRIHAEDLVHPYLTDAVPNPVGLDQERRVLFLTGPNMAGKTTYLRSVAIALYLAHLGMGVPARSFSFVPVQRLFSSISLNDDLHSGVSYFRAEALRVKAIAEAIVAGDTVAAFLDEPFKGTNIKDATDASRAILERFSHSDGCLFVFSSHLIELSQQLQITGNIDYRYFEAQEGEGRLRFDYLLRPGVSSQRLGMRVLKEEGIFDLLDRARAN